jgi:DNA integrity scanning protein DisA with diadenylate cyclase activity
MTETDFKLFEEMMKNEVNEKEELIKQYEKENKKEEEMWSNYIDSFEKNDLSDNKTTNDYVICPICKNNKLMTTKSSIFCACRKFNINIKVIFFLII